MGNKETGVSIEQFMELYGSDPFYSWCGLDSHLMYSAHKASGGMTSIYRQLGKGCENLFREIIINATGYQNRTSAEWSYTTKTKAGKEKTLSLDARLILADIQNEKVKLNVSSWVKEYCELIQSEIPKHDIVFEVRQGYKSKDSKRQNADIDNIAVAWSHGYLPVFAIFSGQIWFGNAKCQNYSKDDLFDLNIKVSNLLETVEGRLNDKNWIPSLFNIERWWSNHTLKILASLRAALVETMGEPQNNISSLAWIAFCRLIIETSSAAFNHVSMSFSADSSHYEAINIINIYKNIFNYIISSCSGVIKGNTKVISTDARFISKMDFNYDLVITSPPYPNRMSYIRELRPYMYWTKFLEEASEAGEMDWKAIGGTWGIATSRLSDWTPKETKLPSLLYKTVDNIQKSDSKNGKLLANYVLKYFYDMNLHFSSLRHVLSNNAKLHYIVGNSTFFGNMVDTAEIMSSLMKSLDYQDVNYFIIRKRNCNKALFEYNVSAKWNDKY